jgi:hypothetical protein
MSTIDRAVSQVRNERLDALVHMPAYKEVGAQVTFFDVKAGQLTVRIRGGNGVMPDIATGIALPPEKLIEIGEAVAHHYRRQGWRLPRGV